MKKTIFVAVLSVVSLVDGERGAHGERYQVRLCHVWRLGPEHHVRPAFIECVAHFILAQIRRCRLNQSCAFDVRRKTQHFESSKFGLGGEDLGQNPHGPRT